MSNLLISLIILFGPIISFFQQPLDSEEFVNSDSIYMFYSPTSPVYFTEENLLNEINTFGDKVDLKYLNDSKSELEAIVTNDSLEDDSIDTIQRKINAVKTEKGWEVKQVSKRYKCSRTFSNDWTIKPCP